VPRSSDLSNGLRGGGTEAAKEAGLDEVIELDGEETKSRGVITGAP